MDLFSISHIYSRSISSSVACIFILFSNNVALNWVCAKDKTQMFINEEGRLRCSLNSTDQHSDKIINWKFDCGAHGSHESTRFLSADYEGFNYALGMAVISGSLSGAQWVAKLIQALEEQYKK